MSLGSGAGGVDALTAHQSGVCERDDDVGIELIQHGALDGPNSCGVAGQRGDSHLCDSQARPQQAQRAAGPSAT